MNMHRWFQVLVLGGAAMVTVACTEAEEPNPPEPQTPPRDGGENSDAGMMHSPQDLGTSAGDAQSSADSGSNIDAAMGMDSGVGDSGLTDTGAMLMCSTPADPADPCGCPCCWAVGYLNTDPECGAFCMAGNNGMGCCE